MRPKHPGCIGAVALFFVVAMVAFGSFSYLLEIQRASYWEAVEPYQLSIELVPEDDSNYRLVPHYSFRPPGDNLHSTDLFPGGKTPDLNLSMQQATNLKQELERVNTVYYNPVAPSQSALVKSLDQPLGRELFRLFIIEAFIIALPFGFFWRQAHYYALYKKAEKLTEEGEGILGEEWGSVGIFDQGERLIFRARGAFIHQLLLAASGILFLIVVITSSTDDPIGMTPAEALKWGAVCGLAVLAYLYWRSLRQPRLLSLDNQQGITEVKVEKGRLALVRPDGNLRFGPYPLPEPQLQRLARRVAGLLGVEPK
ncbi:MAG: hypothetical protein KC910_07645 [Candidatus Eremiobacteraeota bacterium]|nr:hypothetical protein [Candidatus Eremiobacteraeota bacterium]